MSFQEIPRRGPGADLGLTMTAALYLSERGSNFRLMLGRDLLKRLNWHEHDRLKLLFGRGADLGRARLERTPSGGSKLLAPHVKRSGRGCLVFSTQRLPPESTTMRHGAETVSYQIADDALHFEVPAWFLPGPSDR